VNSIVSLLPGEHSNEELQQAFKKLHNRVIEGIDVGFAISSLYSEGILNADDYQAFNGIVDAKTKARKLMALLHAGQNPQAFVVLYQKLAETRNNWLIEEIHQLLVNGAVPTSDIQKCEFDAFICYAVS
jgi:hypothetical protein